MINLTIRDFIELITGGLFIWFGIYVVSKNPFSKLYWLVFALFLGFGLTIFTDSILLQTPNIYEYIKWQKITDWPLFLAPIFFYHISLLTKHKFSRAEIMFLIAGYIGSLVFYIIDIKGGLILKETEIRLHDFRRVDGFEPGILLAPSIIYVCLYVLMGTINYISKIKRNFWKFFFPGLSGILILFIGTVVIISYYTYISWVDNFFSYTIALALIIFAYGIVKYHAFPSSKVFDKAFLYKTIAIIFIVLIYLTAYFIAKVEVTFPVYVLLILTVFLVLFSHSFYDWFSTFINDLIYNVSSGLSVVNDEEVNQALKDYCRPSRLESSSLLRLELVEKQNKKMPVDALRNLLGEAIDYFKPETSEKNRRIKPNLKYQILKMIAFDQAEEGQILWELGFDEYPVKILTQENKTRKPLFNINSPSDYSYISRNAFIALKKEAVHDVAWRISYLEKLSKKKMF